MMELPKHSDLLKLPELLYGIIKKIGVLNNEPILYGDVNLLKPGNLYYIPNAKLVYRYIKTIKKVSLQILPGLEGGSSIPFDPIGIGNEDTPDLILTEPPSYMLYFETINGSESETLSVPEEERGKIRRVGKLFNKIIYAGDANLINNGDLYYHETLPFISSIGINDDGIIEVSTEIIIGDDGETNTITNEYEVGIRPPHDYSKDYLTFEALEDGVISFNIFQIMGTDMITSISYSTDNGKTWTTTQNVNNKAENLQISVEVEEGDKVLWKGIATQTGLFDFYNWGEAAGSFFSSNCEFNAYGNIMSLLYGDGFVGQISLNNVEYIFTYLFNDYDNQQNCLIVSAKNLILPATILSNSCYMNMFLNCTSLIIAPELPATTLTHACYTNMFYGCTSLTEAPELPAITLAEHCYNGMFYGCTSLIAAPILDAQLLVSGCYNGMFNACSNLREIAASFITTPSSLYTKNWVKDVAEEGIFIKGKYATWNVTGDNGVPTGWEVYLELPDEIEEEAEELPEEPSD